MLGYPLELAPAFSVYTGLDGGVLSLCEVTFTTGAAQVPPGYDSQSFALYSNIVLTFDTSVAGTFANDLGTGQANMTEVGCVGVGGGVTTTFVGRLVCVLRLGSSTLDPPQVVVGGYDAIAPNTTVTVYVAQLRALASGAKSTVAVGVRLTYKNFGNITAYYYGPLSYQPPLTSALNVSALAPNAYAARAVYTGSNQVLQTGTYNFTFQLAHGLAAGDYFSVQFPQDYFARFSDYSGVAC